MADLYKDFVPTFAQIVEGQLALIDKAEAFCAAKGIAPETLLEDRLAPDMLPLKFQLQQVARHSAGAVARVTGAPQPKADGETFPALRENIGEALATLKSITPGDLAAAGDKPVAFDTRVGVMSFNSGADYLTSFAMPNFMFHAATAYGLMRKAGVDIGKRDFMGNVRFAQPI